MLIHLVLIHIHFSLQLSTKTLLFWGQDSQLEVLAGQMHHRGFAIVKSLVTDLDLEENYLQEHSDRRNDENVSHVLRITNMRVKLE